MLENPDSDNFDDNSQSVRHRYMVLKSELETQKKLIDLELNNLKMRVESLSDSNKSQLDSLEKAVGEAKERARDAMHISVGVDGKNGLRGSMETIMKDLTGITKDLELLRQTAHSYNSTRALFTRLFTSTAMAVFIQFAGAIWFVSAMHSKQEAIREDLNRVLIYIDKQQQAHEPGKSFPNK